jgi:hypothetical protein
MSKKFHIALGVKNIEDSIEDYTKRLNCKPAVIVPDTYALFKTETLNISIRKSESVGLRHLGWEDPEATDFSEDIDVNGIPWERFASPHQIEEITSIWPHAHSEGETL